MQASLIRAATPQDAHEISTLLLDASEQFVLPDFSQQGRDYYRASLQPDRVLEKLQGDYRTYVALDDTHVIGVISLRLPQHLYYLFVRADHHRRGVATQLWRELLTRHPALMTSGVTVSASRYAVAAYRRLGFEVAQPEQERHGVLFTPMTWTAP